MDFAPATASGIAAIFVIFTQLPFAIAITSILVIPIGVLIVYRQITTQKGIRVELNETKANMDGTIVELLGGIETIRALDSVAIESDRIDHHSECLRRKEMNHHKSMAFYDCLKFLNEAIFSVVVIAVSVILASQGTISIGSILTTYLCFTQLTGPLRELHRILDEFSECMVLSRDYFSLLNIPVDFSYEMKRNENINLANGEIQIRNMNFSYPEKPEECVITNMNLTIPKGQFLGIAGPSGCGKSSLIKILAKLEPANGDVTIAGYSLREICREDLSDSIAYVPQTPFLIAGTIYHNICYGLKRETTLEEVKEAARRACIAETIESLPGKYDFLLSEGGKNLSGGQRQRIAIARIFLRNPKILILDEATSALDNNSEKYIQSEIEKLKEETGTTILSIAHRLTTLRNCDRIIVMEKGVIVQSGTYESLFNQG